MIEFFHHCLPPKATAQQRRHTRAGATYQPANVRLAAATLQAIFEQHKPEKPLAGPVEVTLRWTWPGKMLAWRTARPDLDNLAKLALDAMTAAGYWHDDSQVACLTLTKCSGPEPGIYCRVEAIAVAVGAKTDVDPTPDPSDTRSRAPRA
jgi:Holliday junction resolvase RusA-like endonuclease